MKCHNKQGFNVIQHYNNSNSNINLIQSSYLLTSALALCVRAWARWVARLASPSLSERGLVGYIGCCADCNAAEEDMCRVRCVERCCLMGSGAEFPRGNGDAIMDECLFVCKMLFVTGLCILCCGRCSRCFCSFSAPAQLPKLLTRKRWNTRKKGLDIYIYIYIFRNKSL